MHQEEAISTCQLINEAAPRSSQLVAVPVDLRNGAYSVFITDGKKAVRRNNPLPPEQFSAWYSGWSKIQKMES